MVEMTLTVQEAQCEERGLLIRAWKGNDIISGEGDTGRGGSRHEVANEELGIVSCFLQPAVTEPLFWARVHT